ncbi:YncE family protein [Spirochaeta lutea]|uniref:Lipoprotein LpqB beta-propeller domain-containing protein n=1 Tax=Spirochaeta lutea TaxID=1480694 RepID=A0A098QUC6_9SPIO|nr:hypothetical protein [Spirochaeta lutea]KGE71003.1 hypothetical protein DC28_13855 [Spirochaeta lutea]
MAGIPESWKRFRGPVAALGTAAAITALAGLHQNPGPAGLQVLGAGAPGLESQAAVGDLPGAELPETAEPAEGALFLVLPQARELVALDTAGQEVVARVGLPQVPLAVVPTPGGVSVFVLFEDSDVIRVYSAQTFELQNEIATGLGALRALSFSPNGDRVWVISPAPGEEEGETEVVTEFSHRLLELSDPRSARIPRGFGPVLPNRRGTRLYRPGAEGIGIIFSQNLEVIETLPTSLELAAFDGGYTELWGLNGQGQVTVVDERTGGEVATFDADLQLRPPVVTDVVSFVEASGRGLVQFAPRSREVTARIGLDFRVQALTRGPGETVLALGAGGEAAQIAMGRVVRRWKVAAEEGGSGDWAWPGGEDVLGDDVWGVASLVQKNGSFACF